MQRRKQKEKVAGPSKEAAKTEVPAALKKQLKLDDLPTEEELQVKETTLQIMIVFLVIVILYVVAFCLRLFSVIRYESIIHEFDPHFNFRGTKTLVYDGVEAFYNWFDTLVWYPLGRWVGHTVYPGLMLTSGAIYHTLHFFNFPIDIRNVCVFLAPLFAGNTALVTFLMARECWDTGAGLVAAAFVAIVPGYISRSVAGSYDNEAIAIFAIINTFFGFVKAVKTGRMKWAAYAAVAYMYMVHAWGGYIYIINLVPVYVYGMVLIGRYSHRLYVAFSTFYILGTLFSLLVPFVGFAAVISNTHMAAPIVFALLQFHNLMAFMRGHLGDQFGAAFKKLIYFGVISAVVVFVAALVLGIVDITKTGRFFYMLNPAANTIPIIASISEHQATPWSSFFFDLSFLVMLMPVGMYYCFREWTDGAIFLLTYGVTATYFGCVMTRLILVLAPAACMLAGVGVSRTLTLFMRDSTRGKDSDRNLGSQGVSRMIGTAVTALFGSLFFFYVVHCSWITSEAYSSPSIILQANGHNGQRVIFDDYREGYFWLQTNTAPDAKIMSWWDYGYQMASMSNRTTIVDNNTWNNTHIATVGRCLASSEEDCYRVMRKLDVDYVLVVFGGYIGYSSDDINKFLWPIRIGGSVYPMIKERDYLNQNGEYRVDSGASKRMLNSMMYKMCYYRFGEVQTSYQHPAGFDRVRNTVIGRPDFKLSKIQEAFTTEHWMVRIYRVRKEPNRG
eukprot:TRINITY_DN8259_c0_g1_i1.p2 TRINITY_DN8259_c0_g1~~TRINITY_DN8259_c0_g1_i1.p2  ORF type:complete len:728 (+),score=319.53 TRINITY_DN8259_c0_g1_i1:64-2247(+)